MNESMAFQIMIHDSSGRYLERSDETSSCIDMTRPLSNQLSQQWQGLGCSPNLTRMDHFCSDIETPLEALTGTSVIRLVLRANSETAPRLREFWEAASIQLFKGQMTAD